MSGTGAGSEAGYDCACRCGAAQARVRGRVLARFLCHCTICQELYQSPYADVVALQVSAWELAREDQVRFRTYRPPPALSRGTCITCGGPVLGLLDKVPGVTLAFVPTRAFADPSTLPAPRMHLFYHRRVRDIDDDLPKHAGYVRSELAVSRALLGALARG